MEGRRAWIPEERLDALFSASPVADLVRLLPPADPFLQARDRDLLVPERARRKALWRILGNPGAVLADGEIVGVWRARRAGKARLEVTVQTFDGASAALRAAIEAEVERVTGARGAAEAAVRFEEG
ncbi:MAG: DNA glycosylase AlkZ-like family protein [Carbonactinosporaceae bacterium]